MTAGIGNFLANGITKVTKADAFWPIVGLEATVVGGRTKKAYDRGKVPEARERFIEETSGSVVWLGGVKAFNWIGDQAIGYVLNTARDSNGKRLRPNVDLGQDELRKPFNNFINNRVFNPKNFSERSISMMKFGKVVASVAAANYIIGFVVPPMNHKITNYFAKKDPKHIVPQIHFGEYPQSRTRLDDFREKIIQKDSQNIQTVPAFKGGLNTFTNFIENTNTGSLLSTDLGVLGGRTYNARKKEERNEIIIRDGGSIYFYMFAQEHVRAGLNRIETGRWTRLDPSTAKVLHENLSELFNNDVKSMSVEDFQKAVMGENRTVIDLNRFFGPNKKVITLEEFNAIETNPEIQEIALKMSELQPKQLDKSVLSKDQVVSIYTKGRINAPEFLKKSFETFTEGASSNPNKFVSAKKLEKLRERIAEYVDDICKAAKGNNNVVDQKLLNKTKNKNLAFSGFNFVVGFATAALFLSTLIPNFQYWFTKKTTGRDDFPGTTNY